MPEKGKQGRDEKTESQDNLKYASSSLHGSPGCATGLAVGVLSLRMRSSGVDEAGGIAGMRPEGVSINTEKCAVDGTPLAMGRLSMSTCSG
jgi:hypothetical protein